MIHTTQIESNSHQMWLYNCFMTGCIDIVLRVIIIELNWYINKWASIVRSVLCDIGRFGAYSTEWVKIIL